MCQINLFITGNVYFNIETDETPSARPGEFIRRGLITVRNSLENLADRTVFEFWVFAKDQGQPPLPRGNATVIITVSKGVQDLKPKWKEDLATSVSVYEVSAL